MHTNLKERSKTILFIYSMTESPAILRTLKNRKNVAMVVTPLTPALERLKQNSNKVKASVRPLKQQNRHLAYLLSNDPHLLCVLLISRPLPSLQMAQWRPSCTIESNTGITNTLPLSFSFIVLSNNVQQPTLSPL